LVWATSAPLVDFFPAAGTVEAALGLPRRGTEAEPLPPGRGCARKKVCRGTFFSRASRALEFEEQLARPLYGPVAPGRAEVAEGEAEVSAMVEGARQATHSEARNRLEGRGGVWGPGDGKRPTARPRRPGGRSPVRLRRVANGRRQGTARTRERIAQARLRWDARRPSRRWTRRCVRNPQPRCGCPDA
jgi:hypothetical protein